MLPPSIQFGRTKKMLMVLSVLLPLLAGTASGWQSTWTPTEKVNQFMKDNPETTEKVKEKAKSTPTKVATHSFAGVAANAVVASANLHHHHKHLADNALSLGDDVWKIGYPEAIYIVHFLLLVLFLAVNICSYELKEQKETEKQKRSGFTVFFSFMWSWVAGAIFGISSLYFHYTKSPLDMVVPGAILLTFLLFPLITNFAYMMGTKPDSWYESLIDYGVFPFVLMFAFWFPLTTLYSFKTTSQDLDKLDSAIDFFTVWVPNPNNWEHVVVWLIIMALFGVVFWLYNKERSVVDDGKKKSTDKKSQSESKERATIEGTQALIADNQETATRNEEPQSESNKSTTIEKEKQPLIADDTLETVTRNPSRNFEDLQEFYMGIGPDGKVM